MKKTITQLTTKRLFPLLLGFAVVLFVIVGWSFRSLVLSSMEDRALSIAQTTKAGLTAHMKAGLMDKRNYFLKELSESPDIKSFKIIRSDEVNQEFGESFRKDEKKVDVITRVVFQSKIPSFSLSDWSEDATMQAIIPYIATTDGNLNCLECHHVEENTVLGAIELELDVSAYRNQAFRYLTFFLGIILVFAVLILFATSSIIEKYVRKPLLNLIDFAKAVFYHIDTKEDELFESDEFTKVASEFRKFGRELEERELRIEEKASEFKSLNVEMDTTLKETLFAMGEAEEKRSKETRNHTRRVVEYSRLLSKLSGMNEHDINLLETAAPLHDIGKIGIPDSILLKPGKLSDEEFNIMKTHTTIGNEILRHSEREVLQAAAKIAYEHHERWDGKGYPRKLRGEDIHIFGRIVAIADVFDALGTKRVYKEAWPLDQIWDFFEQENGKAFDPKLSNLLLQYRDQFESLYYIHYKEENSFHD